MVTAAVAGFILLAIVLFAFLYDLRTTLISVLAIPLSLIAAGLVLYFTGATVNMLVLNGFVAAIAVVVYDAVIDVEHCTAQAPWSRRTQFEGCSRAHSRSFRTKHAVRSFTRHSSCCCRYADVLFGRDFRCIFQATCRLLTDWRSLRSMVVALTVTPALCLMFLPRGTVDRRDSSLVRWCQQLYGPLLGLTIATADSPWSWSASLAAIGLANRTISQSSAVALVQRAKHADPLAVGAGHVAARNDAHHGSLGK